MSLASDIQDLINEVVGQDLTGAGLVTDIKDLTDDLTTGEMAALGVAEEFTYHSADTGQTYEPDTGEMTAATGSTAAYTTVAATGISEEFTYHSALAATSETYDPETGDFISSPGDGGLWFDDEDNSHWVGWGL
jgi:hypothetical protein